MHPESGVPPERPAGTRLHRWWSVVDAKIGTVPVPVFLLALVLAGGFVAPGSVPTDIRMNIVLLSVGGFVCAEIGKRLPCLNRTGAAAVPATFLPSFLVFAHVLPAPVAASITAFTNASNILYLHIATIIVAPIMAGGVGEGAIPLSIGYAQPLHEPGGSLLAEILPAVMIGSLAAILTAGVLNLLGKRRPALTGEGRLSAREPALQEPERDAAGGGPNALTVPAVLNVAAQLT